jgi:hypothetical protein
MEAFLNQDLNRPVSLDASIAELQSLVTQSSEPNVATAAPAEEFDH